MVSRIVGFQSDGLLVSGQTLGHGGRLIGAGLGARQRNVGIRQIGENYVLVGIQFRALFEGLHRRLVIRNRAPSSHTFIWRGGWRAGTRRKHRLLAAIEGVVQFLVLRHGRGILFGVLLQRVFLLLAHAAFLLFA